MAAARAARSILLTKDDERTPILSSLASLLTVNQALEQEITDAILGDDEIADRASAELAQIRKKMRVVSDRVREKLNSIVHGSSYAKYLQETIITVRNGRYCVPVKAECRANVPGPGARPERDRRDAVHRTDERGGARQRFKAASGAGTEGDHPHPTGAYGPGGSAWRTS